MSRQESTAWMRWVTAAALWLAAIGFVTQMVAGVTDTPTIPPGLVAILLAAALVTFVTRRWMPIAGVICGLFNLAFSVPVGAADRLIDPISVAGFVGNWLTHLALVVACGAGVLAIVRGADPPAAADG